MKDGYQGDALENRKLKKLPSLIFNKYNSARNQNGGAGVAKGGGGVAKGGGGVAKGIVTTRDEKKRTIKQIVTVSDS